MGRKRKSNQQNSPNRRSSFGYYRPNTSSNNLKKDTNKSSSIKNIRITLGKFLRVLLRNVFVVAIIIIALFNTTISGASVKVTDAQRDDTYRPLEEYTSGVNQLINDSFLNKSKITMQSVDLEGDIVEMFPEVIEASVIVPLAGRKLQVGINFDEPFVRLSTEDKQRQGIVGKTGGLISTADSAYVLDRFSNIPNLTLEPAVNFNNGEQVLTSVEVDLFRSMISEFDGSENHRPKVKSAIFRVEKRELEIRFEGVNYYAILTPERDTRPQVGSLLATLKRLDEQGSVPKTYIDARVDDRVFVK